MLLEQSGSGREHDGGEGARPISLVSGAEEELLQNAKKEEELLQKKRLNLASNKYLAIGQASKAKLFLC